MGLPMVQCWHLESGFFPPTRNFTPQSLSLSLYNNNNNNSNNNNNNNNNFI